MHHAHTTEAAARHEFVSADERRRHQRVSLRLPARFLTGDRENGCRSENISAGGALFHVGDADEGPIAAVGARVIVYVEELGRFEGTVVRADPGSFALKFQATPHKLAKTADNLTWLLNRGVFAGLDERRHARKECDAPAAAQLADGSQASCRVLDISLSGASLAISPRPEVGAELEIGGQRARVVRHHPGGVGVEFIGLEHQAPPLVRRT